MTLFLLVLLKIFMTPYFFENEKNPPRGDGRLR